MKPQVEFPADFSNLKEKHCDWFIQWSTNSNPPPRHCRMRMLQLFLVLHKPKENSLLKRATGAERDVFEWSQRTN